MKPHRSVLIALLLVAAFGTLAYARQQDQARPATAGVTASANHITLGGRTATPATGTRRKAAGSSRHPSPPPSLPKRWASRAWSPTGRNGSRSASSSAGGTSRSGRPARRAPATTATTSIVSASPLASRPVRGSRRRCRRQDSRVGGYTTTPVVPVSMKNTADLRLAYAEVGKKSAQGVFATVGRQELTFGDGRMMASPDWGNVSKTYDSVRLTAARTGVKVDAFFGAPVDVSRNRSRWQRSVSVSRACGRRSTG